MEQTHPLYDILQEQLECAKALEEQIKKYEQQDISQEYAKLTKQLEELLAEQQTLLTQNTELTQQNKMLNDAVQELIQNEKIHLLQSSKQNIDLYFANKYQPQINHLKQLETSILQEIDCLSYQLQQSNSLLQVQLLRDLNHFKASVSYAVQQQQAAQTQATNQSIQKANIAYQQLQQQAVASSTIHKIATKNKWEQFIGLNLLNKIGVFLIVVGVFAASQFAYRQLSNGWKGAFIYILGLFMLLGGEYAHYKKYTVFSIGIISGSISVLYLATGVSFFSLHIIGPIFAFLMCAIITGFAFLLSIRHNSQVVASFALIGGYLPLFTIIQNRELLIAVMVYFFFLHALLLIISFRRKWSFLSFFGLAFNVVGTTTLAITAVTYAETHGTIFRIAAMLYSLLSFANYTLIPIISCYFTKKKYQISDLVFLIINTVFGSCNMYAICYMAHLSYWNGSITTGFLLLYLLLAAITKQMFYSKHPFTILCYITAITFASLVVPAQWGIAWVSLGWVVQGVLLYLYGVYRRKRLAENAGLILLAVSAYTFVVYDVLPKITGYNDPLFFYKYSAITIASIIILVILYKHKKKHFLFSVYYPLICTINIWFYVLYSIYTWVYTSTYSTNALYLAYFIATLCTTLYAYILYIRFPIANNKIRAFTVILYSLTLFLEFLFLCFPIQYIGYSSLSSRIISLSMAWGSLILLLFCFYQLLKIAVPYYPNLQGYVSFLCSFSILLLITQHFIVQLQLSISNILISTCFALTAIGWIVLGFRNKQQIIRQFGLVLSIITVVKLFIFDLHSLTAESRILSYFMLGISLIFISFIYQQSLKKWKLSEIPTPPNTSPPSDTKPE